MKRVLITGAHSFVGTNIAKYLNNSFDGSENQFYVDTIDTMNEAWRKADFSSYDTVFHVAGIGRVDPKPEMAPLYYKVNRDLAIEIAKCAKEYGVKQFIFMSTEIVYKVSKTLKQNIKTFDTKPCPNDIYGDSKLQAENGLKELDCPTFKICILRPPMIYGFGNKDNISRLRWLATQTLIFPEWHNKRSALFVDNLAEFVKQCILREMAGTYFPQNAEYFDTVEIVRQLAKENGHRVWISRIFNPLVFIGSYFSRSIPKMFADSYYVQEMSKYDFDYQLVSLEDSIMR